MRRSATQDFSTLILLLFLGFFLIFVDNLRIISPLETLIQFATIPVQKILYVGGQTVRRETGLLGQWRTLYQDNLALRSQNDLLRAELSRVAKLKEQNDALMTQLSLSSRSQDKLLPAQALGLGRFLEIDRGERDGVKIGMVVIVGNSLVGEVTAVSPKAAQIKTIYDPDLKAAIKVQTVGGGQARGIATGYFGSAIRLEQILQEEKISEGDIVLTSGEGGRYPADLGVGKIIKIEKKETDVFQSAQIEPFFKLDRLQTVFVLLEW